SIYIMIYGHLSPGGGFQAGVILAVSVILLLTAHGHVSLERNITEKQFKMVEIMMGVSILLLIAIGLLFGTMFYNYIDRGTFGLPFSGGIIPIFNILVGLKVGAGFMVIYYALTRWFEDD
ncbi:MAG: MnhB domain-containing protein, partial [Thermoplasmata archaeon]